MTLDHIRIPVELFSLPLKGRYEMAISALAYSFGDKGLRMSNGKLAKTLHTSSRTVERVIARLRKNGFLIDAGNRENGRCLKISTDIRSGIYTDIKPVSTTDTMSAKVPTSGGVTTDMTADHKLNKIIKNNIKETSTKPQVSLVEFMNYWNSHGNLLQIHTFTDQRKRALATRSKEPGFVENWKLIIDKLSCSPFHTGQNNRKWQADVDWLLKNDTNYVRIIEIPEGEYTTRPVSEEEAEQLMAEVANDN